MGTKPGDKKAKGPLVVPSLLVVIEARTFVFKQCSEDAEYSLRVYGGSVEGQPVVLCYDPETKKLAGSQDAAKFEMRLLLELESTTLDKFLNMTFGVELLEDGVSVASGTVDLSGFVEGMECVRVDLPLEVSRGEEIHGEVALCLKCTLASAQPNEDGSALAEPEPFRYVAPEDGAEGAIVSLSVEAVGPLPETMAAASEQLPAPFELQCALRVPGVGSDEPVTLFGQGSAPLRSFLSPTARHTLLTSLEVLNPVRVEIARYLPPGVENLQDTAFDFYHGLGSVTLPAELLDPGRTRVDCEVGLSCSVAGQDPAVKVEPLLPPKQQAAGKAPAVEAPPALGKDEPTPSLWVGASTQFRVTIALNRPFYPPWEPPPPPSQSLEELIPPRVLPEPQPLRAVETFKAKCRTCIMQLASEYRKMLESSANTLPGYNPTSALAFELNRTGRFAEMRDAMRDGIVNVVRENFKRPGIMSKEELNDIYNDLYMFLQDHIHATVADLTVGITKEEGEANAQPQLTSAESKALALELETAGNIVRAEHMMQDRLTESCGAEEWFEYGTFCLRQGNLGEGEAALRKAVAIDSVHLPALLALAAVLWHNALTTDPICFEQAEVLLSAAREVAPNSGHVWALQSLLLSSRGSAFKDASRNAAYQTKLLAEEATNEEGAPPGDNNGYLKLGRMLVEWHLSLRALDAARKADELPGSDSAVRAEVGLLRGEAQALSGMHQPARALLKEVIKATPREDIRALVALADSHYAAAEYDDAQREYEFALKRTKACPLRLYLRLAECYIRKKQHSWAANVYGQAVAAHRCGTTWLGLGTCMLKLGNVDRADVALTEANMCDPLHPDTWGQLMLLAVTEGRMQEAAKAEVQVWRHELRSPGVLHDIADAYVGLAQLNLAERFLKRAIQHSRDPRLLRLLANTLAQLHDYPAAVFWFDQCLEVVTDNELREAVQADKEAALLEEGAVPEPAGVPTPMDLSPDLTRDRETAAVS